MKTRLQTTSVGLALAATMLLGTSGCNDDWGQKDPESGNQVFPTLQTVATIAFEDEDGAVAMPAGYASTSFSADATADVLDDEIALSPVLSLNNAVASFSNPLKAVKCQTGVSLSFWMHQPLEKDEDGNVIGEQDLRTPIIAFVNPKPAEAVTPDEGEEVTTTPTEPATSRDEDPAEEGSDDQEEAYEIYGTLAFTANGGIVYDADNGMFTDNSADEFLTGYITPDEWHFVALNIYDEGYAIYVDGMRKADRYIPNFDCHKMVEFANNAKLVCFNGTPDSESAPALLVDDVTFARNNFTAKEVKMPKKGNIGNEGGGGSAGSGFEPIAPIYFNSFDGDNNDVTIHGDGEFKYVGGQWGTVYSNGMDGMRQNYLVLPSDVLSQCNGEALSISVWVNRGNETASGHYMWSPLFSAYGAENTSENTFPMFIAQYRGILQTNCGGTWTDYTDAQNVNGRNNVYHDASDWLADGNWHHYTCVITDTHAVVYFDGEIVNEWDLDGGSSGGSAAGLLGGENGLSWICLGGNQAWNWGDPDPGFWFDDVAIYNKELSQETVKTLMSMKNTTYANTFSNGEDDATVIGDGTFIKNSTPNFGMIFKNAVGGMRQNYLKVPATALAGVEDTEAMTVAMWVNSTDAGDYYWNPLVTAYGDNGTNNPTFALQYRGIIAINTESPDNTGAEYCDFGAELSDNGEVVLYHGDRDWLADKEWHLYTAVFDGLHFTIYFDGEVANAWTLDGVSRGQICNYKSFPKLTNICICGNQQWDWGDPDPGFGIDDVMFYNRALSQSEIKQLMLWKK